MRYYVFVKSSFKHTCEDKFNLLGGCHVVDVRKGIRSKNAAPILVSNTPGKGVL